MFKIGVLVSGGGTNLQAIVDTLADGWIVGVEVTTVISSNPEAFALERAARQEIPAVTIQRKDFADAAQYEEAMVRHLKEAQVDLVVLAGFMTILGKTFIDAFANRIINVHPSLIPSFCGEGFYGLRVHEAVLEAGVKVTGATVHVVTEEPDAGPIVIQQAVMVLEDDTPETLQKRVMEEAEWQILPEAIRLFSRNRVQIQGKRAHIVEEGAALT